MPDRLSISEWKSVGDRLAAIAVSSAWWLGDCLVYGQNRFRERYRRAIAETSLDYQTLRNYAWLARKFPVSRRRDSLSVQHHAEVARLPEAEQDMWLSQAAEFCWSRNELRRRLKGLPGDPDSTSLGEPASIRLEIAQHRRKLWEGAAQRADCSLSEWMLSVLDSAATGGAEVPSIG
ncbi:hypothetical protein GCM10012280_17360 [Wenjunlia tyrosinilytica]|uniref:LmbU n=1 Tax=Wenjunlia tyrosinilytica TaxID=1544741 RepID=A0A917ZJS2_9ACTN|nr:hypothetical protein GCM10012280_17360 [Wenjunlia tyrosinilytica]